ncbi:DinB family protein [Aquihabitans sp. McL0605]|uniref:DinB family protein n=1 Tax=Aquihabitans sp. McL0605 TaxID=3415671 RepID=UPI003CEB67E0
MPTVDPRAAEKAVLVAYLGAQRRHVLGILDGLDDEAMRRPVLPSGWSCVAMVQHLTLDEERFWFGAVMAGDQEAIDELGAAGDTWTVAPDLPVAEVMARYRSEIERSDAIIAGLPLDAPPAWWPGELFGDWRLDDLREVLLHMIVELACHAGHLDAARELIDGRQWLVLTD